MPGIEPVTSCLVVTHSDHSTNEEVYVYLLILCQFIVTGTQSSLYVLAGQINNFEILYQEHILSKLSLIGILKGENNNILNTLAKLSLHFYIHTKINYLMAYQSYLLEYKFHFLYSKTKIISFSCAKCNFAFTSSFIANMLFSVIK